MAKRYIRRLKVIVMVFLLTTLTVIVGARGAGKYGTAG